MLGVFNSFSSQTVGGTKDIASSFVHKLGEHIPRPPETRSPAI